MIFIIAIAVPVVFGAVLPALKLRGTARNIYMLSVSLLTSALIVYALVSETPELKLISLSSKLGLGLRMDDLGRVFAGLMALLWPTSLLYSIPYMKDASNQDSFFSFFVMSYGVTLGIAMSANLLTLYFFYEALTLTTLPLVMHGGSRKSISAGLKYIYYSLGGSAFAFIGLIYLVYFGGTTEFRPGGLFVGIGSQHTQQLRLGYLLCFMGFGVKAAIFPLHGWLPAAAVAPTPVTALLHAVAVVKSGVFSIIRVTYFSFGPSVILGSYAQGIPLALAAFTIIFGCSMALKEKHLKRRLAYSTVSNLSYILFGAMLLTEAGLMAALMHLVFHALMKITLFFCAGVLNKRANAYYVADIRGISAKMGLIAFVFSLASLAMSGIPPLLGLVSKWSLAQAAAHVGGFLPLAGICALLISSLLTSVYLLVPAVTMYTRPLADREFKKVELNFNLTLTGLSALMLVVTFYNRPLIDFLQRTAEGAM